MLPPNALPRIKELLVDDYLTSDSCSAAVAGLQAFYAGYHADEEIEALALEIEQLLADLIADCVDLAKTSVPRSTIYELIKTRTSVSDLMACRILAAALHRWSLDCDEGGTP